MSKVPGWAICGLPLSSQHLWTSQSSQANTHFMSLFIVAGAFPRPKDIMLRWPNTVSCTYVLFIKPLAVGRPKLARCKFNQKRLYRGGLAATFDLAAFGLYMIAPVKISVNHSKTLTSMREVQRSLARTTREYVVFCFVVTRLW